MKEPNHFCIIVSFVKFELKGYAGSSTYNK